MKRRSFLSSFLHTIVLSGLPLARTSAAESPNGGSNSDQFNPRELERHARALAAAPYRPPPDISNTALGKLGWDDYIRIRFQPEKALWHDQSLAFRIQLFHLGRNFLYPVSIYEVVDGRIVPITFSPDLFDYGATKIEPPLPDNLGFAGFRLHYQSDFSRDMVAFLGASYFRAVGAEMQYGLSARGIAIDTALPDGEEFPLFKAFWIVRPAPGQTDLKAYALLDSESITGTYEFDIRPGRVTQMDVQAKLFPRKAIRRLGIAPLTSMYHHGENDRRRSFDFRPEVHDSDGLSILRGNGEQLWRPLVNPKNLRVNLFNDSNPKGFGLLQRDGDFDHYQDDGVFYDKRPSLWIEPLDDWGDGSIHLVEIPTDDESFDNVVAFWTPAAPVEVGRAIDLRYRLHWGRDIPATRSRTGRVVATRFGQGGIPGQERDPRSVKFVIDFKGGPLELLTKDSGAKPDITVSRGRIVEPALYPVAGTNIWRALFDLHWEPGPPIDLRCYLRLGTTALSETWSYQWLPSEA